MRQPSDAPGIAPHLASARWYVRHESPYPRACPASSEPCSCSAALAAPAVASPQPLPPPAWVLPGDGTSRPASSWPAATPFEMVDFTLYVYAPFLLHSTFEIEVATSSTS